MDKFEDIKTVEEAKEKAKEWSKKVFSENNTSIVDEVNDLLKDEDPNTVIVGEFTFKNKG